MPCRLPSCPPDAAISRVLTGTSSDYPLTGCWQRLLLESDRRNGTCIVPGDSPSLLPLTPRYSSVALFPSSVEVAPVSEREYHDVCKEKETLSVRGAPCDARR